MEYLTLTLLALAVVLALIPFVGIYTCWLRDREDFAHARGMQEGRCMALDRLGIPHDEAGNPTEDARYARSFGYPESDPF